MSPRLIIFGLDGATFDLVRPWAAAGFLPALRNLMQRGACGDLESTLPPLTAAAWPSFMTGKNPGKHGVFDFFRPQAIGDLVFANSRQVAGRWWIEEISDAGLSVALLNVPMTHPPRPINGYLVPGTPTSDEGHTTFPRDLLTTYERELGAYRITPRVVYEPGNEAEFCAALHELIDLQTSYARRLMTDRPTDVVMVHFLATDSAQHALWKHQDVTHPQYRADLAAQFGSALRAVFEQVDRSLAQILELASPDTNVIVMSDHGFGPLHHTVNVNNFFVEHGLLALKPNRSVQVRGWMFRHDLDLALPWKIMRRLRLDSRLGQLSRQAHAWSQRKMLTFADVDWSRTVAYSWGHLGQVYVNLKGRDPHGWVEPSDYLATRERVARVLESWRDPITGKPVVDEIIPREAAAHGPHLNDGPDLHLIMDGYRTVAYPLFAADGRVIAKRVHGDSGSHRRTGLLMTCGADFARSAAIAHARLIDLAPTILHMLDVPIPTDYDGHVLTELLSDRSSARSVRYQTEATSASPVDDGTFAPDAQTIVAERLRALGYLG